MPSGGKASFEIDLRSSGSESGQVRLLIHNHENVELLNLSSLSLSGSEISFTPGSHKLHVEVPNLPLAEGLYSVSVQATDASGDLLYGAADRVANFTVVTDSPDTGKIAVPASVSFKPST